MNILGLFNFFVSLAWLVMMALLVWTIRLDHISRNTHSFAAIDGDDKGQRDV